MAFWTFNQNNSGGSFDFDIKRGITHFVIIEAASLSDALERATEAGIYFDGCRDGRDCECCGDRWYEPYEGSEFPDIYGENIREEGFKSMFGGWMQEGHEVCIHPLSGPLEWLGATRSNLPS